MRSLGPTRIGSISFSREASTALSSAASSHGWAIAVAAGASRCARSTRRRNLSWPCSCAARSTSATLSSSARRPHPIVLKLPAAAERLVEVDGLGALGLLDLGQLILGREQLLLGLDHLEIGGAAVAVA